jgi:hypothetical protein
MNNIVKTIYARVVETSSLLGHSYVPDTNTTLNNAFNIPYTTMVGKPVLGWYTLGASFDKMVPGVSVGDLTHSPMDGSLFLPTPLIARPIAVGLNEAEKDMYRLIRQEVFNNETYITAYAKAITNISNSVSIYDITYKNNVYTVEDFIPVNHSILTPTPIKMRKGYGDVVDSVAVSSVLNVTISVNEQTEISSALELKYPDLDAGQLDTLGEMGLITAADDGKELTGAQLGYIFRMEPYDFKFSNREQLEIPIDIGGLALTDVTEK